VGQTIYRIRKTIPDNVVTTRYAREKAHPQIQTTLAMIEVLLTPPIRFTMCKMSANFQSFEDDKVQGFVTLVPMGDAELIRL